MSCDKKSFRAIARVFQYLFFIGSLVPYHAHAECVIKELPDQYDVVCTGVPLTAAEKEMLASEKRARETEEKRIKAVSAKVEQLNRLPKKAESLPSTKKTIAQEKFSRQIDKDRKWPGGKKQGDGKEMSDVESPNAPTR